MRPGGGHAKGATFERRIGQQLSIWLTGGVRADLFARNVLSGGRFTLAVKAGIETSTPGDLMAAHPAAFTFLARFMVECKHYKDLQIPQYLMDRTGNTFLAKVISKAEREAQHTMTDYMVIAQQNQLAPLVFLPGGIGDALVRAAHSPASLHYHRAHSGKVLILRFDTLTTLINADKLLNALHKG